MPSSPSATELISSVPFNGFDETVRHCLRFLNSRMGFQLWLMTRVEGDDWIVLAAEDHGYDICAGQVFKWKNSFGARLIEQQGPSFVARADIAPVFESALGAPQTLINAYIGVPITLSDGRLFGMLCAIDSQPQPAETAQELPLIELVAQMITTQLETELKLQQQSRRTELMELKAIQDSVTGLNNRQGWERFLEREEERCRRYGHPAGVITIELPELSRINENLGYAAGDKLMQLAALILQKTARPQDVLARLGNNVFAYLAVETGDPDTTQIGQRLRMAMTEGNIAVAMGFAQREPVGGLAEAVRTAESRLREESKAQRIHTYGDNSSVLQPLLPRDGSSFLIPPTSKPAKILVVDDIAENTRLLNMFLKTQGYDVISANNGEQALTLWADRHPDMILLDVMMPGMSGFEVAEHIRRHQPANQFMPILMTTALQDTEDKVRAIESGAIDYITKPFEPAELLARVRAHLHTKTLYDNLMHANAALQLSEQRAAAAHTRLLDAIESIGEAFALFDADDRLVQCNSQFLRYWAPIRQFIEPGVEFSRLCELSWDYGMVRDSGLNRDQWLNQRLHRHRHPTGQFEQQLSDERRVLVTERRSREGGTVAIGVDITEQHRLQQQLVERNRMLGLAEEIAHLGHWHYDLRTRTSSWSDEVYRIHGLDKSTHLPDLVTGIVAYHPDDRALVEQHINRAITEGLRFEFELRVLRPDGALRTVVAKGIPESDEHGTVTGLFGVFLDITERKKLETELRRLNDELAARAAELRRLATIDSLTGVFNRRAFLDKSSQEIARAKRYAHPLAVIMFDVDHFKRINDTHGHSIGDMALKAVVNACRKLIRRQDVMGRLGGEEFAMLLPETPIEGAAIQAERLREAIAAVHLQSEVGALQMTCSLGVAMWKEDQTSIEPAIQRADQALYRAKQAGRNRVEIYSA